MIFSRLLVGIKALAIVNKPTLPNSITITIISSVKPLYSDVRSIVKPTVPKADITSNNILTNGMLGLIIVNKK